MLAKESCPLLPGLRLPAEDRLLLLQPESEDSEAAEGDARVIVVVEVGAKKSDMGTGLRWYSCGGGGFAWALLGASAAAPMTQPRRVSPDGGFVVVVVVVVSGGGRGGGAVAGIKAGTPATAPGAAVTGLVIAADVAAP